MVYSGYILIHGIQFEDRKELFVFLKHILGIKPKIPDIILKASKDTSNVWNIISKDVINLIFSVCVFLKKL